MSKLEEITAIFHRERIRFNEESVVIECESTFLPADDTDAFFTVKLKAAAEDLVPRLSYRFYGKWTTYQNRRTNQTEKQFDCKTFVRAAPHGRAGVVAYLLQAGKGRGLGPARAAAIWDKFGSDSIRIFRETPEVVAAAVPALAEDQIEAIAEFLRDEQDLEACSIEMVELLTGRGLPRDTARKAIKEWGNRAAETIKRDPYKLMGFRGCGFRRCDALYLHLGLPATRLRRQALCAWYSVASDTDGHTWYPVAVATQGIRKQVGGTDLQPERAIEMATRLGRMSLDHNGALSLRMSEGRQWVAEGRKAWCEDRLAQAIVDSFYELNTNEVSFKTIDRFDGYRICSDGTVWSCWTNSGKKSDEWKLLAADEIKGGYLRVRLRTAAMQYECAQVSHLVLEAFVGDRPLDAVACHGDGNPKNNAISNLRWDTRSSNEDDKRLHGTHQTGSKNPAAKITEADAIEIRRLYDTGDLSTYKLSEKFGISRPVVCKIVKRQLWTHV